MAISPPTMPMKLPAWLGLGAAALLLLSPFVLGFSGTAVLSAFVLGILAIAAKLKPMIRVGSRDRWLVAAAGALIVVAPWLLGFANGALATWTHVILGVVLLATAIWSVPFRLPPGIGGGDRSNKSEGSAEAS